MATDSSTPAGPPQEAMTIGLPLRPAASVAAATLDFDIVSTYRNLIATEPELTKPVAAIEALIKLLGSISPTTIFETLDLLKRHAELLRKSVQNPLPLTAGIDLFFAYMVSSLNKEEDDDSPSFPGSGVGTGQSPHHPERPGFDAVREHLLQNSRLFADRAIAARDRIAEVGWRFIYGDMTVLTHGASRAVFALLARAAEYNAEPPPSVVRFRVIYVMDEFRLQESQRVVADLRALGIEVAEISEGAVTHVFGILRRVQLVFLGAEVVTSNGGVISRIGTLQIARAAYLAKVQVYIAAETHKFVRKAPIDQRDLGFYQRLFRFSADSPSDRPAEAVDYTPPEYISKLITENGVKMPGYVLVQLLQIYGNALPSTVSPVI